MKTIVAAQELTIYIGENDQWHGRALHAAVVERLKDIGIAGVTVTKGAEGYGVHRQLHTARLEVLFEGLPIVIRSVDEPEQIARALSELDAILTEALITVNDVQAIRYTRTIARS